MDYQIALPPELGLKPDDFVAAWNDSPEARSIAEAHLSSSPASRFNPLPDAAIVIVSTVGLGVATNAIYDLLKQVLIKKGVKKRTKITSLDQPDGTRLLIVETEDR